MIKEINSLLSKVSHISYDFSNINAINEIPKGNLKPIKNKAKKKIKRILFNKIF